MHGLQYYILELPLSANKVRNLGYTDSQLVILHSLVWPPACSHMLGNFALTNSSAIFYLK